MAHAVEAGPSTSQFFTGGTPADQPTENCSSMSSLEVFFDIDETVRWISDNNYNRVALQLPDHFLARAYRIAKLIESKADTKTFVLADTSYRSCCVDEVAASHASCDAMVHYGDACLSALPENIPVKFVFGSFPLNLEAFSQFPKCLATDVTTPLLLLTDACYSDKSGNFLNLLYGCFFCSALSTQVCFVGDPTSPLVPLWLMSFPQCTSCHSTTIKQQHISTSEMLRKRLFLIEKLRDARTVGLVVGCLGVKREAVHRVRELCKAAGKRLYVISVGKVNVPKLSNFVDIDVFVLLSCPFGVILDSTEFFRPVLSMFEAEVALNPLKKWSGDSKWCADFSEFLNGDDDADVSLITGKVRSSWLLDSDAATQSGQMVAYQTGLEMVVLKCDVKNYSVFVLVS
ncbi:unnamed protein product [Angiostrongylus costaricensis]|uniref:2-(3-amino-3-carboxypropyl)histidine synthase subunit 2 n=1 Tax=Angiostrongylus costaricensis TaxID=334426 RepID=A0A158PI15_ANGCS|nr:unnamed protein product [Angiostrongylus costaricensis]